MHLQAILKKKIFYMLSLEETQYWGFWSKNNLSKFYCNKLYKRTRKNSTSISPFKYIYIF